MLAFFAINLLLSLYFIDTWTTPNSTSRALPVLSFWEEGTLKINTYQQYSGDKSKVGEDYYSDKAPFPTFVMIPVYGMMRLVGFSEGGEQAGKKWPILIWPQGQDGRDFQMTKLHPLMWMSSFLLGALPFAFLVFLSFYSLPADKKRFSNLVLILFAWYGSFVFVFSGTFFNHVLAGALLVASYYFLPEKRDKSSDKRNLFLSGACLGAAFLTEYPYILAAPFWMLAIWFQHKDFKKLIIWGLGLLPFIITILVYNYMINGNPIKMLNAYHAVEIFGDSLSQNYGFSLSNLSADSLWGLSFSPYMGIFWFAPMLFLGLWYWIKDRVANKPEFLDFVKYPIPLFAMVFFLVMASFFTWWGGWSFGPRYLVPLACLLLFETIRFLSRRDFPIWPVLVLGVWGLIHTWTAKASLMYMCPDGSTQNGPAPATGSFTFSDVILPALSDGRYNGNNLLSSFGVNPAFGTFFWLFLFAGVLFWLFISQAPKKKSKT